MGPTGRLSQSIDDEIFVKLNAEVGLFWGGREIAAAMSIA